MLQTVIQQLKQSGIRSGDRVALLADAGPEMVHLIVACWCRGVVVVPLSMRSTSVQVEAAVENMGCRHVITNRNLACDTSSFTEIVSGIRESFGGICLEGLDCHLEQDATLVLTSGSTGTPKGVLHALSHHYYSALGSDANIPFGADDRWLVSLPLYHMGGLSLIMRSLLHGGTLVFPKPQECLSAAIQRTAATHVSVVPTQLKQLLGAKEPLPLKTLLVGGAPCSAELVQAACHQSLPVFLTYGSTEMASQVTTSSPAEAETSPTSCGHVLEHRELKLSSAGEILVRGATRFKGYWSEGALHCPCDEQGWFATGDIGRFDEQGPLFVLGRRDTLFISGGENIYPEEIERAMLNLAGVTACVVVPVVDEVFGQRPVAFVKTSGFLPDPKDLDLPIERFKYPRAIYIWPEQVSPSMKPDRVLFRELAERLIKS